MLLYIQQGQIKSIKSDSDSQKATKNAIILNLFHQRILYV